jgi:hypothetical protein
MPTCVSNRLTYHMETYQIPKKYWNEKCREDDVDGQV